MQPVACCLRFFWNIGFWTNLLALLCIATCGSNYANLEDFIIVLFYNLLHAAGFFFFFHDNANLEGFKTVLFCNSLHAAGGY